MSSAFCRKLPEATHRQTPFCSAAGNPEGCEIVAGGRSQAKTSGFRSQPVMHPGGVTELAAMTAVTAVTAMTAMTAVMVAFRFYT